MKPNDPDEQPLADWAKGVAAIALAVIAVAILIKWAMQ